MRTLCLSYAFVALALTAPSAQPSARPNVVMFIMDDLGYGDVGSYGAPDAKTPNIDRLAREGVKLTDFYANHANCSPTRTAFISGRYQQRSGIESPLTPDDKRHLPPSETSLPRLLKHAGYATGLFGKWHLGADVSSGPNRHGFDEFWGFRSGAVDYYTHNVVTTAAVKLDPPIQGRHDLSAGRHHDGPHRVDSHGCGHTSAVKLSPGRPRSHRTAAEGSDRGENALLANAHRARSDRHATPDATCSTTR